MIAPHRTRSRRTPGSTVTRMPGRRLSVEPNWSVAFGPLAAPAECSPDATFRGSLTSPCRHASFRWILSAAERRREGRMPGRSILASAVTALALCASATVAQEARPTTPFTVAPVPGSAPKSSRDASRSAAPAPGSTAPLTTPPGGPVAPPASGLSPKRIRVARPLTAFGHPPAPVLPPKTITTAPLKASGH